MTPNDFVLIYTTFANAAEAETAGSGLVDRRLAACVNIIPGMTSIYEWEGRRERSSEVIMIVKTRASLGDHVIAEIRAGHAYSNPAVVAVPIVAGSPDYLTWLGEQTAQAVTPDSAVNR